MPKGGLARRASAIEQFRQQAQGSVLVLDSGNSLFATNPTKTSDHSQGALPVAAMNAMGYDAMALGERDLAAKADLVGQRLQEAAFPILSANVGPEGVLPNLQPYLLLQTDGRSIAMIGATAGNARNRSEQLGLTLEVEKAFDAVQRTVEELRGQAEVIIVLSNLAAETNEKLAQEVAGIDAIIGVAGGRQMDPKAVAGPEGRVVLHASYVQGEYLGVLTLDLDEAGRVLSFEGRSEALAPQYADDPGMVEMMQEYEVNP
ncbi:MAG: hypothetical protein JXA37_05875 [Chloroflexia bacterium]|nr:hypothetical protein [Chloroflexia bacterium]